MTTERHRPPILKPKAIVNIEYPIEVNQYLRGDLDYYLESKHNLLVVEAQQTDLTRGFTQLATELIALDTWVESDESRFNVVSSANRFGNIDANFSGNFDARLNHY